MTTELTTADRRYLGWNAVLVAVSGYITNPNFYAEPETGSTLAVWGN